MKLTIEIMNVKQQRNERRWFAITVVIPFKLNMSNTLLRWANCAQLNEKFTKNK